MTRIGQAIHAVFGCYLRRSWKKVLLSHGDLPIEVYECRHCDKKWLKYSDCGGYWWRLINGEYCKELRDAVNEQEDTVMVRKGSNPPPPGNKPKPPASPPMSEYIPRATLADANQSAESWRRQAWKTEQALAAKTDDVLVLTGQLQASRAKNKELNDALHALPDVDESNEGWGGTLKGNILCHLRGVDTDERFWELARKADAGHTRAVAHIVFRAFNRMVDEADRADAAIAAIKQFLCPVNAVTVCHRHGSPISDKKLTELSNRQIDIEDLISKLDIT